MTSDILPFVLRFYLPLFLGIVLVILVIFSPKFVGPASESSFEAQLHVGVLGFVVPLRVWLKRVVVVRIVILAAAATSLFIALSTNFANFFPDRLRMDVYFDVQGIERTMTQFPPSAFDNLTVALDWRDLIPAYDSEVRQSLGRLWVGNRKGAGQDARALDRNMMHATGSTSFLVTRVGPLSYHVDSANGQLQFGVDVPHQPSVQFSSQFHLRETAANHLRPSFFSLVKSPSITIRPEFKQVLFIQNATADAAFDHMVIGLTQITLLPFPELSNTLYLWKLPDGRIVPVAYAVYY